MSVPRTRILRTTGFRLAALYAGLFGLSALVLFGVIYWTTSEALRQQLATTVNDDVTALTEDYRTGGLRHAADTIERLLSADGDPFTFYLLLDPEGRKIAGNLATIPARIGWQNLKVPDHEDQAAEDDPKDVAAHHLMALGTALPDGSFLLVGEDAYRIVEVQEAIIRAFGWAAIITIVLAAAGGIILSIGFLRRVDAINDTTRAIIEGKLADRVPIRGTGDELDRLAINLNDMLDRTQTLMDSLRQVSSDIAHDLRTPLNRLRQRLEGVRVKARRIEDYETAVDQAIADTDAILKTFAALLRIAQIEAGTLKRAFSTVDLSSLFRSIEVAYGAVAEDQGQILRATIGPDLQIQGDRELLTQMLANLVENALRHTPPDTMIELVLERRPSGGLVGIIADSGPGIPLDMREKVFRRFFRLEQSRSTAGNGLGLALAAAVADIHGISITLADNEPGLKVLLDFAPTTSSKT